MEMDICGKKMRSDYKFIYENSNEITELIQIALACKSSINFFFSFHSINYYITCYILDAKVPYDDVHHEEGFPLSNYP